MKIPLPLFSRRLAISVLLVIITFPAAVRAAAEKPFVHPGGFHTEADLERIRAKVKAGEEPWSSAWAALEKSDAGLSATAHVNPENTNNYMIQNDGHAIYALAIKWVASGDERYAKVAIKMINDWTSVVKSIGSEPMRSGLGSSQMAQGAEILAYGFKGAAGWDPAEVKRAKTWFKEVVYPHVKDGASANWGTSAMAGLASMGVFCDDREIFNRALDAYKEGFVVNGSLKGGCCGVTQYIDATGENAESGRDQGHSQGGIAHLVEVALIGWNQGFNMVAYNDQQGVLKYGVSGANRLWLGLEYTAKYNLGNEVPYHPFFEYCNNVFKYPGPISDKGRGNFSPIWEMAYSLFTMAKLDAPYCKQIINQPSYIPEKGGGDHPGLGTLTFRK